MGFSWGNHKVLNPDGTENTAEDFIGNINPIRYRSYYYDTETKLYYLNPVKPGYGNPLYMSEPMSMKLKLLYISITEKFSKRIANSFFDGLFETVYNGIYDAYNN